MDDPGSAPGATRDGVSDVFARGDRTSTPMTAAEIAADLECPVDVARDGLEALVDRGDLQTKLLDGGTRIWWSDRTSSTEPRADRAEFEAFVSEVEDYAIFTLDPDGVVASWNEGARRIKGYEASEILGEHFSTFYTEEDVAAGVPEENLEAAAEAGHVEDEGWRVTADGSEFWANVTITAVRDDDGELQGFTKVTRDMTDRRSYERKLEEERDLTNLILETVPISITVVDEHGQFRRTNQRMAERIADPTTGLERNTMDDWEIYDEDGKPIPVEEWPWHRVLETGEPVYDFQCQADLPTLGRRWVSVNAAPLPAADRDDDFVVVTSEDVTETREREQRLQREKTQTEKLLRTAPIAITVQDADGEVILANRRAQEALGLTETEIIGDPDDADDWRICDADGVELADEELPSVRVLATGEPILDEEIVVEPPDGDPIYFSLNAVPIVGEDGTIERVVIAGEDITELKHHERQLKRRKDELETELSEILDRVSDAFYALDEEWRVTHVNEQAAEVMGHTVDELLGRNVWEVFPDASPVYRDNFDRALDTQEPVTFEDLDQNNNAWLEFTVYPSASGLSIYFRDVTERRAREERLRKYETIVETVDDGIYVKDEEGRFTMVNDAYAELTGYDRAELVGAHASLVVDEDTIDKAKERSGGANEGSAGQPTMEAMIEAASGERVPAEATFTTIETADGRTEEVGVVRDISDRREYERKLEASNERLEQFAYAASHDLQEPLRMVSSYLQLLERRYGDALDAEAEEFIDFAVDGADRMRTMIDGLLEYSRVETQGDPFESVDLDDVLADARDNLRLSIEESGAEITSTTLPTVAGDAGQLQQVFQNLLENAIEYSGDEPPRIHVDAERAGDRWRVSVADEGIGIGPDDHDRIFEVFQRLHSREVHEGTGIGLALCERIVERHGGDIWVDSEPGEGTTFTFSIPPADESGE